MRRQWGLMSGIVAFLWLTGGAGARQAGWPAGVDVVRFQFEPAAAGMKAYTIVLDAEGRGSYGEAGANASGGAGVPIRVGAGTLAKVLAGKDNVGVKPCETKLKHIANTGQKTLSYKKGSDGQTGQSGGVVEEANAASCVFNYSDAPVLNEVASIFIALAETMQIGERLVAKHRFDRLGLDLEMETLNNEVKGGRALEVGNIRPVLDAIVNDDRVIDRVRRTAARLLQESAPEVVAGKTGSGASER